MADTLKLSLIIGSFGNSKPFALEFGSLHPIVSNESRTTTKVAERWGPKPEITHTFKQPQKLPNKALSILFNLAVLASLPILLFLVFLLSQPF